MKCQVQGSVGVVLIGVDDIKVAHGGMKVDRSSTVILGRGVGFQSACLPIHDLDPGASRESDSSAQQLPRQGDTPRTEGAREAVGVLGWG